MNLRKVKYHIHNIFRCGIKYEANLIRRKLKIIDEQPYEDILKNQDYWHKHPEKIKKGIIELYGAKTGKELNFDNPRTFNEKINWMKLYDNMSIKTYLADKYLVRDWVKEKIGEEHLIPIYGAWSRFDEIDFSILPDCFVLKCNHGSMMNMIVYKNDIDMYEIKKVFDRWMETDYSCFLLEPHYSKISRKIIAEQYIGKINTKCINSDGGGYRL